MSGNIFRASLRLVHTSARRQCTGNAHHIAKHAGPSRINGMQHIKPSEPITLLLPHEKKEPLSLSTINEPCTHNTKLSSRRFPVDDKVYLFERQDPVNDNPNGNQDMDKNKQNKRANLGSMIDEIKTIVPNMFTESFPTQLLASDVLLRICPTHFAEFNAYLPNIKGHVSYYTTCKTLQLILTSLVLNPKVKIHIQSIRASSVNSTDTTKEYQCVYPQSTKIYVRWTTCSEGCSHLSTRADNELVTRPDDQDQDFHSTSDAKLGSHSWSKFDTSKLVNKKSDSSNSAVSNKVSLPSIKSTLSNLTKSLIGLTKEEKKLERVISGLFIFELNDDNSEVIVHTIEDVDVIERTEVEDVDGKLRVC